MMSKKMRCLSSLAISLLFAATALFGQPVTHASAASDSVVADPMSWKLSIIDMAGDIGWWTSLALDSYDKVHISYYDMSNGDLKYATNANGWWETSTINQVGNVGSYASLALDSYDKVHISYYDETNRDLKYVTNAGGSWAITTIDSKGSVGLFTSIAIDPCDKVHISYVDESKRVIKYATNVGGPWTISIVDSVEYVNVWGSGTSLAIDSSGMAHIGYVDAANRDLKYATNAGGPWSTFTVEGGSTTILGASLALDSNDKVHIGYFDSTFHEVKYATNSGGSWNTCPIGIGIGFPSLALDSLNNAHISYSDDCLMYATNVGGSWITSTVDNSGWWGSFNSIELDSSGFVHISYYEGKCEDLKYATNEPTAPVYGSKLILHNGVVVTMEGEQGKIEVAQAIAIEGDSIVAVGDNEEILKMWDSATRVVDLRGMTVLPGFIDSHAHRIDNYYLSGLGTPPYETGRRWLPPWTTWYGTGDKSAQGATVGDSIQATLKGGWTSISEMFAWWDCMDEMIALDQAGELKVRVNAYLPLNSGFNRYGDWYKKYEPGQEFSSKLRIGGVKIFADSSDYGRSAYFEQEELTKLVEEAHQGGYQIAIHACDAGIDLALNAFDAALGGETNAAYRYRIEHLVVLSDEQIDRMADLGIVASFQYTWFTSNPWDMFEVRDYIGFDNGELVGRWHDILAAEIPSIGSTDYPWYFDVNGSAIASIYKAVTRLGQPAGQPSPQWLLNQRITVEQAIRLLTIDAAYGTFQKDVKGSIAVGKFADLVVLSDNPLAVPPERLMDVSVLMTMVGGQVEYCKPGHEYLYGSAYSPSLAAVVYGTPSDTTLLPTPTEESAMASEAITSFRENA